MEILASVREGEQAPEGRDGVLFWRFGVCARGCRVSIAQRCYRLQSLSAATATADELLRGIILYRLSIPTQTHKGCWRDGCRLRLLVI